MMRTTIVPLRNIQFKPAFWGVDRNLRDVMETIENVWEGSNDVSLSDFKETDQAYFMSLDIPGVNKNNLEIQTEGDHLYITANRKMAFNNEDGENLQKISRTVTIPKLADKEKIQAHCEDGVLYLALPKVEKAKPQKIEIAEGFSSSTWNTLLGQSNKKLS